MHIPEDHWTDTLRPFLSTRALRVIDALKHTELQRYKSVKDVAYTSTKGPMGYVCSLSP